MVVLSLCIAFHSLPFLSASSSIHLPKVDTMGKEGQGSESTTSHVALLSFQELPQWAQENAYITDQYWPTEPFKMCIAGLTSVHNETGNIYSHLLLALPSIALFARTLLIYSGFMEPATFPHKEDIFAFAAFLSGTVACMVFSATYHTVRSHSEQVATNSKHLDYAGITCLIWASFAPTIYYCFTCEVPLMWNFLGGITAIALVLLAFFASPWAHQPWAEPFIAPMFAVYSASALVPLWKATTLYGWSNMREMVGTDWIFIEGLLYLLGLFCFITQVPERLGPGKFNVWGSSHQVFHVFIAIAATTHFVALLTAYGYQHAQPHTSLCPLLQKAKEGITGS
ncbi:hemolysin-III related-domain-containing protein [Xylariomycetidae sp. FL2044]|nr:hemolysin-III related-domain-containing protein [Xylariomycetidae sp. FL2044]